jgi:hypothetical protein
MENRSQVRRKERFAPASHEIYERKVFTAAPPTEQYGQTRFQKRRISLHLTTNKRLKILDELQADPHESCQQ